MSNFYVYTLAKPDGTVFYVGQGRFNRMLQHEIEARRGVQSPKCDTIRAIWAEGGQIIRNKVKENLSSEEARKLEIQLIYEYSLSDLTNRLPGRPGRKLDTPYCEFRYPPLNYRKGKTLYIRNLPQEMIDALEKRAAEEDMKCEEWLLKQIVVLTQSEDNVFEVPV